jgi:hypothetical protein
MAAAISENGVTLPVLLFLDSAGGQKRDFAFEMQTAFATLPCATSLASDSFFLRLIL